jgi:hypothetical protein
MVCFGGVPDWPAIEAVGVWVGAAATLAAVWWALRMQNRQFREERRREAERRAAVNVAVHDTTVDAITLCGTVRDALQVTERVSEEKVWEIIANADATRRVLRHFLDAPIPLTELVSIATFTEQRLYEVSAAAKVLQTPLGPGTQGELDTRYAAHLTNARNQIVIVARRLEPTQTALAAIKSNVEADRALLKP